MYTELKNLGFDDYVQPKKYMKGAEPYFFAGPNGTGVLLLHGFTATPYQFKELRKYLADQGFTVYAPSLAGHGTHPDELRKTSIYDWVRSAEEAVEFLKTKAKNIIIIGNSFGGNIAFQLALKNDPALKGIVSLGTPVFMRAHRFIRLRTYTYGWLKRHYKKRGRNYREMYTDMAEVISYPVIPMNSLRDFFRFLKYFTLPGLKHVKTPTLIIQAEQDPVVHPKSAQHLHEFISSHYKKVCWIDGPVHSLPDVGKKDELFEIIRSFISEVTNHQQPAEL